MKFDSISITGPKGNNQDAILPPIQVGDCIWCAIADGVGSSSNGGLAAKASIDAVRQLTGQKPMGELFADVHEKLASLVTPDVPAKTLSTTLTVLCICNSTAFVGHVGDTRISHFRGSGVMGRTKDQTEVQKPFDDGVLTTNQEARYPRRNVLLSAMSLGRDYDLHEQQFDLRQGDRVLLTTDGFHNKLMRRKIAQISSENRVFSDFWTALCMAIESESIDDDATCLALEVE